MVVHTVVPRSFYAMIKRYGLYWLDYDQLDWQNRFESDVGGGKHTYLCGFPAKYFCIQETFLDGKCIGLFF